MLSVRDPAYKAGLNRLKKHLTAEELPDALAHRSQLINVWRPIGGNPVEDFPLAIADANSVKDEDKVRFLALLSSLVLPGVARS